MKLFVILSVIACGYGAKLDRTYLPPPNAATAGGNPDSLVAPFGSPTGFGQSSASGRIGTASQAFGSPSGPSGFGQSSPSGNFGPARQSSLGSPSGPSGFRLSPASGNIGSTSQGVFGSPSGPSGFGQSSPSGNYGPARQSSLGSSSGPSGFGQSPASGNLGPARQGSFGQLQSGFSKPGLEASSQGFEQGSTSNQPAFGASQNSFPNVGPRGSDNFAPQQEFANQPERPQAGADRSAETLKYINENDGETFNYSFETSNGITAEENGIATNGVQAQGAFSYMGDDGQKYSVAYTADENGYQPQGEHLPTPHPIPEEILKSIEKNSQAAAAGTQEGAYNPEEDIESVPSPQQYNAPSAFGQQPSGPSQQYGAPTAAFNQAPQGNYNQGPSSSFQSGPVQSSFGPSSPAQTTFPSTGSAQSAFPPAGPSQSAFAPTSSAQSAFNPSRPAQSSFAQSGPAQPSFASSGPDQPSFASSGPAQSAFTPSRPVAGPASPNQFNRPNSASFRQPASQNAFVSQQQDESGYKYNRPSGPQTSFGGSAQSASPAPGSGPFGNAASQTFPGHSSTSLGSATAAQSSFSGRPGSPAQGSFNRQPSSPQQFNAAPNNGFQATRPSAPQQYRGQQSAAPRTPMPEYQSAPYQYNQAKGQGQLSSRIASISQSGSASQQPSSPFNPLATQTFNQAGQGTQSQNFNQAAQGQGQAFGGPRQPPSFSAEEGYKY